MLVIMVARIFFAVDPLSPATNSSKPALISGGSTFSARMYNSLAVSSTIFKLIFMLLLSNAGILICVSAGRRQPRLRRVRQALTDEGQGKSHSHSNAEPEGAGDPVFAQSRPR